MNKNKEVIIEKISDDLVRSLDASKVEAIEYAEIGAQGHPNSVAIISADKGCIRVDVGKFGYKAYGDYVPGDVDIESVERVFPFIENFWGISLDNLVRNHCVVDQDWVHLNAHFGNHFFVRGKNLKVFLERLNNRNIYSYGIKVILGMLKERVYGLMEVPEHKSTGIIGAIVGDIAGSRFEFHNVKSKDFELLVSGEDVAANRKRDWEERKCAYAEKMKAAADRKWWQLWRKRAGLGKMMSESGALLSSSIQVYEDDQAHPCRNLERPCRFTDDSVMTLAIAAALMDRRKEGGDLKTYAISRMQEFGLRYPDAGYGGRFWGWIRAKNPHPYNSWGNGSAMRVSACGWAARTLDEVKELSRAVTEVTHNHPEGIKGAEATAVAVYLALAGKTIDEIREVIDREYYPMNFTLDEIRPGYSFDVSCQGSVPQALEAFFESTSFEDAIRNAISIGGDSDTIGAITGAVAGAYYGVPDEIRAKAEKFLPDHLMRVLYAAESELAKTDKVM